MTLRKSAMAAVVGLMLTATSLQAQVCGTTPFNAGPVNPANGFADYVVDSNGLGLKICTEAALCFFDPVISGNTFSETIGFGAEGFWYLAENTHATSVLNWVMVMGVEAAFATEIPAAGQQFPFTRYRMRLGTSLPGTYTVTHPWGSKEYVVAAANTKRAVNDTVDIQFMPNSVGRAMDAPGPWLTWDPDVAPLPPQGYIGDGATPHAVVGSPCNTNFVRVTARDASGGALVIDPQDSDRDGSIYSATQRLFVVQGQIAELAGTPLSSPGVYYGRNPGLNLHVFANSVPNASATYSVNGTTAAMTRDGSGRLFATTPLIGQAQPPVSVQIDADTPVLQSTSLTVAVTDLVTISKAEAVCTGTPRNCTLTVQAESSDRDPVAAPVLTLSHTGTALTSGAITVPALSVLPGHVTVTSSAKGSATKAVTVIHQ